MAKISQEEAAEVLATADLLYSPDEVERTLDRMAMEITGRLGGRNNFV